MMWNFLTKLYVKNALYFDNPSKLRFDIALHIMLSYYELQIDKISIFPSFRINI